MNILKFMKRNWLRVLYPSRWKPFLLILMCLSGSMIVYKSVIVSKSISTAINLSKQNYERFVNETSEGSTTPSTPKTTEKSQYSNLLENECRFPSLIPWEFDIQHLSPVAAPILCPKNMSNLATFDEDGYLLIHNDLDENFRRKSFKNVMCNVSKLVGGLRPNQKVALEIPMNLTLKMTSKTKINVDQFVVRCYDKLKENGTNIETEVLIYQRGFAGFANQETNKPTLAKANPKAPSLVVLVLDSTSRNQFLRHAPKSWSYMNQLGFMTLNGYTKVGDNSGVNLLPIVAGLTAETQVGEDGRGVLKKTEVPVQHEKYEHLWDLFKKRNCVTMINDDIMHPSRGLFAYHYHKGFAKPPTNYYFRPFEIFNVKQQVKPKLGECTVHGVPVMTQHFDLFEKFSRAYKDYCHFSFNFFTTLTHDHAYQLEAVDEQIRDILETFNALGVMNNTAVVIMGDHGNRIGGIQHTYTGRIEERAPLFSLYLPEEFKKAHPEFEKNFNFNANRLTSNYDIYRTLKEIALAGQEDKEASKYRGYNLFREQVPTNRKCSEAGIPENFCLCMQKDPLPKFNQTSKQYTLLKQRISSKLKEYGCINITNINFLEDILQTHSISDMARKGMRSPPANETQIPPRMFKEQRFIYTYITTTTTNEHPLRLMVEVKYYPKEEVMDVISTPILVTEDNKPIGISITDVCKN
ncbi:unnamed protein product [Bursaphelenchus okinawaensis]|uniref:Sulfatase domain-containing protein n=1 Tax=Bursaphelenchus okinawaensis TaxID=465554 RepID=A0A811JQ50_9BILA|nr:unnamed protein product [Bursaphelenchus okinawaensis]CAG9077127.1 unnamed protein product [Bursaphelenchus okinawaensis]